MKIFSRTLLLGACLWAIHAQAGPPSYCSNAVHGLAVSQAATTNCGSPPKAPPQGTTPAQIAAGFPAYIIYQFEYANGAMELVIKGMTDKELFMLASFFIQNHGNQATLHAWAASQLSATNLVRWQAAFTQAVVSPYVGAYSPTLISTKYFGHPGLHAAIRPIPAGPTMPADPWASFNVPLEEMYLEFRTTPFSNCNAVCALGKVATIAAGSVGLSWNIGKAIGTTFYNAMVAIDPSYGYDLVVGYGSIMTEYGLQPPNHGNGFVEDSDGTWYDPYGNVVPDPTTTSYGLPQEPTPYPPYTIFDPYGDCLIGLEC